MARTFQVPVCTADKTTRGRSLLCHKIMCMIIAALTTLAAMVGMSVSVSLVTFGMRPLHDVAALWMPLRNATAHPPPESRAPPVPVQTDTATNIFIGVVGFFLTILGVPDMVHVVVSIELIYAAWQGRADAVLRWLRFTRVTTALHAGCALLLAGALLALRRPSLCALVFACLVPCCVVLLFLMGVVHRFHARLLCRQSPTVVFTSVRMENAED